ncbi:MAG: dockerin type I repeat-containing protein [Ruminococcus sp.]
MKRILMRFSSVLLSVLTLFLMLETCLASAYTAEKYSQEQKEEPYYSNYSFQQFYELPDEELNSIFSECGSYLENTVFHCCYELLAEEEIVVGKYANHLRQCDAELMDEFCAEFGLPSEYISQVDFYGSPENIINVETLDGIITLYEGFDIYTVFHDTIINNNELDEEDSKISNIIATILVLNKDVYVDLVATALGAGCTTPLSIVGDINLDGKVDITDAVLMTKMANGSVSLSDSQFAVADCNSDGEFGAEDALTLLKFLVHLVDTLPYTG